MDQWRLVQNREYGFLVKKIVDIQVPAGQRMVTLFLWQTFSPLVVIFCSKPYQRFAVKRLRRLTKGLEELRKIRKLNKVTPLSDSTSIKCEDSRFDIYIQAERQQLEPLP